MLNPFKCLGVIMSFFQVNNAGVSGAIVDGDALRAKLPHIIAAEASFCTKLSVRIV